MPSSQQRAFFSIQWPPLGLPSHTPRDRKSFSDGAVADDPAAGDKAPLRSEISFHWLPAENWSHSGSLPRCMSLSSDTGILSDLWNISLALLIQHKRHKCTHRRGPRAYSSQLSTREKRLVDRPVSGSTDGFVYTVNMSTSEPPPRFPNISVSVMRGWREDKGRPAIMLRESFGSARLAAWTGAEYQPVRKALKTRTAWVNKSGRSRGKSELDNKVLSLCLLIKLRTMAGTEVGLGSPMV